jgi:alpha-galactosidase
MFQNILGQPDLVFMEADTPEGPKSFTLARQGADYVSGGCGVSCAEGGGGLAVTIYAETPRPRIVQLRWLAETGPGTRFLGDALERGYAEFEWRGIVPERVMPWYFLACREGKTSGCGVKTNAAAICWWCCDQRGVSLFLDVRCGGGGVDLSGRKLAAATVVWAENADGESAFSFGRRFCGLMASVPPVLPGEPVYGSNNWYYAYGQSSDGEIMEAAVFTARLSRDIKTRPFMVIDDGWQRMYSAAENAAGGPNDAGNSRFPDMPGLAARMKKEGVKPGIWVRHLLYHDERAAPEARLECDPRFLDITMPESREILARETAAIIGWGYECIKHDYSTIDFIGQFGFNIRHHLSLRPWRFKDRTKTTAEAVTLYYKTIYDACAAANPRAIIIGCNCVGHLGTGYFHLHRSGDDTSGRSWERSRRFGVNSLAFRLIQHNAFFQVDADCVSDAGGIPWEYNRQFLELIAYSGTVPFLSIKPGRLSPAEEAEASRLLKTAVEDHHTIEPLDWFDTTCPSRWRINGGVRVYDFCGQDGVRDFLV